MSTPKPLNPVENKIPYSVSTQNNYIQAPVNARFFIVISTTGFTDGSNLKLDFLGQTWQFDFVNFPDDSGLQLTAKVLAFPFEDWWLLFLSQMQNHPYIFPYYTVTNPEPELRRFWLTAKNPGEIYTVSLAEYTAFVSDEVRYPGFSEITRINFGIHAQIITFDSNNNEIILGEDRIGGNEVEFDFHQYLALAVNSELYFPQDIAEWKKIHKNAIATFFIRHWETASGYIGNITDTPQYRAITGGLPKLHEKLIYENATDYIAIMLSGDILIQTNRPLLSTIHYDQPIQYYFINHYSEIKTFKAIVTLRYSDQTLVIPALNDGNEITLQPNEQGIFLISPAIHNFKSINPDKTIHSIDFYITDNTGELISLTYEMQIKESLYAKGLLYKNSHGVWESTSFFGVSEQTDNYKRLLFETTETKIQTNIYERESLIINSGWLSKDERNSLRDILLSPIVYLIYGNNIFKVNILSEKTVRYIDKEYMYSLELEIELTDENKYFITDRTFALAQGVVVADNDFIVSDELTAIGY